MEFTPIMTQEQFEDAVSERIESERKLIAEQYSDYEDLKKQVEDLTKEKEGNVKKYAGYDQKMADLEKKVKDHERNSIKIRIAHETGLPYELAGRLSGDDEDAIRKDAEALSKFIGSNQKLPPLGTSETGAGGQDAAYKGLLENLRGE